jgi:hypothetical protein
MTTITFDLDSNLHITSSTPELTQYTYYNLEIDAPFRIVISKDDYEMYENLQIYDGCYDTKHKIGLNPVNKIRTTIDGEMLIAVNPELGSLSKMLKI